MYWEELSAGTKLTLPPVRVDKEEMISFSKRFDNIPLHTDEAYAKSTRFGRLIAPGMLSFLLLWAEYVPLDLAGEQLIAGKSSKVEWLAPVFAEDVLHGEAEITALTPRNPYNGVMELTIRVYNQKDELVLTNVTESVVKRLPA